MTDIEEGTTSERTLAELIVGAGAASSTTTVPDTPHGSHPEIGLSAHRAASSLLSADELLLVGEAGYLPRGIVAGAAVFHAGLVGRRMANGELVALSRALLAAREQAMARMRDQAARLGAIGIIGVRLEIASFEDRHHLARVLAVGTAVARTAVTTGDTSAPAPFLAGVTGQELRVLADTGYEPVTLVMGVCIYHVARQRPLAWVHNITTTEELTTYTTALYEARELAMQRLQADALGAGADGVVGVTTSEDSHAWGSRAIEFFCMGTAIRKCGEGRREGLTTVTSVRDREGAADPAALHGRPGRGNGGADR